MFSIQGVKDGTELRFNPPSKELVDEAANLVVSASKKAFSSSLECVILKGSVVKGDFIPGYSDFDFHVFLNPEVMDSERVPKTDYALRFQKSFGGVQPEDFGVSQFQVYFINSQNYPADWAQSVEGTYKVIWGKLPLAAMEADDQIYIQQAREYLKTVEDSRRTIVGRFVDKPDTGVSGVVRLLGATLKSYMHSVLILLTNNPKDILRLRLDEMILQVEKGINSKGHFTAFFNQISDWTRIQQNGDKARKAFKEGTEALDEIAHWYSFY
jgi:predicted nucleotidyltransferase